MDMDIAGLIFELPKFQNQYNFLTCVDFIILRLYSFLFRRYFTQINLFQICQGVNLLWVWIGNSKFQSKML